MIHYLKIKNFGPIKDVVEINFEVDEVGNDDYEVEMADGRKLLKLAYIYGANASGKTTVLKAFDFLRRLLLKPITDKANLLDFEPFLFRTDANEHPSHFDLSFYIDELRYVYEVKFDRQAVHEEKMFFYQTAKPTELFSRTTDIEKRLAKIEFGSRIKVSAREKDLLEINTLHNNSVLGAFVKTNIDIPELEKLNRWLNNYLLRMITSDHNLTDVTISLIERNPAVNKWIDTFLNKADDQISGVDVSDANRVLLAQSDDSTDFDITTSFSKRSFKMTGKEIMDTQHFVPKYWGGGSYQRKVDFTHTIEGSGSYTLTILSESSGTQRYFGLGGLLYELIHGSRLLCIDELESSLHPDLMKHLLQVFLVNAKRSQLLLTTHNISLMENSDFIRRDALWFSEKQKDGSVHLFSAADFDSSTLRKSSSLINAYRTGKLGAKPNLGSPYIQED